MTIVAVASLPDLREVDLPPELLDGPPLGPLYVKMTWAGGPNPTFRSAPATRFYTLSGSRHEPRIIIAVELP